MQMLANLFGSWWPAVQVTGWTLIKIIAIVAPLMIAIAYLTLAERKVISICSNSRSYSACDPSHQTI